MTAGTFNALAAARDLKAAGIEAEHAEAIAEGLREAAGAAHADLATKADIAELKGDIAALRTATSAELGTILWAVGLIAAFLFVIGLRVFGLF